MYTNTALDLFSTHLTLADDRRIVSTRPRRPGPAGWTLALFHADGDADVHADHWEMHPEADELVGLTSGRARLHLRATADSGAEAVELTAGTATVVPRGRWHRITVQEPCDLVAVTVGSGTRHERAAATEGDGRGHRA
jgi:mannose-6-phosphate isomerase-like protein (cupin superfamily)